MPEGKLNTDPNLSGFEYTPVEDQPLFLADDMGGLDYNPLPPKLNIRDDAFGLDYTPDDKRLNLLSELDGWDYTEIPDNLVLNPDMDKGFVYDRRLTTMVANTSLPGLSLQRPPLD
ncbi:hypothetical protein D3C86_1821160 [compost metagenome]